jgi:hypothetical protein
MKARRQFSPEACSSSQGLEGFTDEDSRTVRFNNGSKATPLYIYTLDDPSNTGCITYSNTVAFTQTPQSAPYNPDCGTWGCRTSQPRNDYRAVLDHSLSNGIDNLGIQILWIDPFKGCRL